MDRPAGPCRSSCTWGLAAWVLSLRSRGESDAFGKPYQGQLCSPAISICTRPSRYVLDAPRGPISWPIVTVVYLPCLQPWTTPPSETLLEDVVVIDGLLAVDTGGWHGFPFGLTSQLQKPETLQAIYNGRHDGLKSSATAAQKSNKSDAKPSYDEAKSLTVSRTAAWPCSIGQFDPWPGCAGERRENYDKNRENVSNGSTLSCLYVMPWRRARPAAYCLNLSPGSTLLQIRGTDTSLVTTSERWLTIRCARRQFMSCVARGAIDEASQV